MPEADPHSPPPLLPFCQDCPTAVAPSGWPGGGGYLPVATCLAARSVGNASGVEVPFAGQPVPYRTPSAPLTTEA